MDDIVLILLILIAAGYWWDTQRCNEIALFICRKKCNDAGFQLLDSTVTRQRTWLRKGPAGLQICRLYSFDYSTGAASVNTATEYGQYVFGRQEIERQEYGQREQGYIVLIGKQVVEIKMPNTGSLK